MQYSKRFSSGDSSFLMQSMRGLLFAKVPFRLRAVRRSRVLAGMKIVFECLGQGNMSGKCLRPPLKGLLFNKTFLRPSTFMIHASTRTSLLGLGNVRATKSPRWVKLRSTQAPGMNRAWSPNHCVGPGTWNENLLWTGPYMNISETTYLPYVSILSTVLQN